MKIALSHPFIHPRVSVNSSFIGDMTLDDDCDWARSIGARWIGVSPVKLDKIGWQRGIEIIRQSQLRVSTVVSNVMFRLDDPSSWPEQHEIGLRTIDAAVSMRARCIYGVTGPLGRLTFEEGAEAYRRAMGPLLDHCRTVGMRWALETLNPVYISFNLAGGLADAMDVADLAGVDLCLDVSGFFAESRLAEKLEAVGPRAALVQVSDTVYGEIGRCVPGDGDIPLERLLGWILDAGYDGPFDIELNGRRIDNEGQRPATLRAARVLTEILDRLGA
ncbi:MAG: sugar phosphate isomerase/epimerase family protein [Acidimicrobiia bacterium]